MSEHDYAEALKAEYDMEIHLEEFGFNCTLSIEDSTCEYHNKYRNYIRNEANARMEFHSHFLYDSYQNAATLCEHMKHLIHCMYEENLFIKICILYSATYECIKQYICETALWLL